MTAHINFDHANPKYVPVLGNGRTLRVWFTGRDWCGVCPQLPGAIYHMPSPEGLPVEELKAQGWVLEFS